MHRVTVILVQNSNNMKFLILDLQIFNVIVVVLYSHTVIKQKEGGIGIGYSV